MNDIVRTFNIGSLFLIPVILCSLILILTPQASAQEIHPELMLPVGHTVVVGSAQFSPDGKWVVTGRGNDLLIWEPETGILVNSLKGHKSFISKFHFCPKGNLIIAVSGVGVAKVWNFKSRQLLYVLGGQGDDIIDAQFSQDGTKIVSGLRDGTARIYDAASGELLQILVGHNAMVGSAQFSPDGKFVITASSDSTSRIWNTKTGSTSYVLGGHMSAVLYAEFSPNGQMAATGAINDSIVHVWDVKSGDLMITLEHEKALRSPKFSPDGNKIVTRLRWDPTVHIWNAETGELLQTFKENTNVVYTARFNPNGKKILTFSSDSVVRTWDVNTGELLKTFKGHTGNLTSAVFSADGNKVLTTSYDRTTKIWGAETGELLQTLKGHTVYTSYVIFSNDLERIITDNSVWDCKTGALSYSFERGTGMPYFVRASPDTTKIAKPEAVWYVKTGKILYKLGLLSEGGLSSGYFSPDGKILLTSYRDGKIWDTETGEILKVIENLGHFRENPFSPDGKRIVTTISRGKVGVWDVESGKLLHKFESERADYSLPPAKFSPDGQRIISSYIDTRIWDSETGELLNTLKGHDDVIRSIKFSPDGRLLATGSRDGSVKVWEFETGKLLHHLDGHEEDFFLNIQFSPNGNKIVTTSYGEIRFWDTHTGKLLKEFEVEGHLRTLNFEKRQFITHENSLLHLYDLNTGNLLYSFVAVGQDDWLVIDEHHRYDGSPGARDMLYFVCGLEVTTLNQLRDALYVPGLATKILNGEDINFPKLEELEICGVFPDIQLKKETEDYFKYLIKPGKKEVETLEIWLNNRLFRSLPFSEAIKSDDGYVLSISRPEIEAFFVKGEDNTISVNGLIRLMDTEARSRGMAVVNREYREKQADPRLFSLMIGVNDYRDDRLNLRFPAKDAMDLGKAIELAAGKLLGEDNVFTYYVHSKVNQTGGFTTPEKEGIRRALKEIGQQSRPEDVLLIFFAGHGTVRDSDGQFVLLTADASELLPTGITTAELQEWISPDGPHQMKANKAILIFDACNSGRGAEEMIAWARSDEETRRRRQIDDLSDKAGMYILAASAASQNAYEVRHYEQGLLSYSLLHTLQNNPGILDDNSFLNVQKWFLDSESYLQNMVRELGLQQQAQPYGTANIRIGIVDDEVRSAIRLAEIRPVVYCAVAINSTLALDNLEIKDRLNNALREISDRGSAASVIYSYQGSTQAYRINVSYELEGDKIKCRISLLRANEPVHQMEISGSVDYMEGLIEQILDGVLEVVGE